MHHAFSKYEEIDKTALHKALLALRTCPHCRSDLALMPKQLHVWACEACDMSWFLPDRG